MKSSTLSCLICALNLYFAQKLLEVARSSKNCSKSPKLSKSWRSQSGQAYLSTSKHSRIRIHLHEEKFEFVTSRWDRCCLFQAWQVRKKTTNKQTNKQTSKTKQQQQQKHSGLSVADPDLQMGGRGWGRGRSSRSWDKKGSGLQKFFFCPSGLNKGGIQER